MSKVTIQIEYNPKDDRCTVGGPIHNKGLCYGMLEKAKDAVRQYKPGRVKPASEFPGNGRFEGSK